MEKKWKEGSLLLLLLNLLTSCSSSGPIRSLEVNRELPKDVSIELKSRFEVKEAPVLDSETNQGKKTGVRRKQTRGQNREISSALGRKTPGSSLNEKSESEDEESVTETLPETLNDSMAKFPNRRPAFDPFKPGERLIYSVSSFLNVASGEFISESLPFKYVRGRKSYNFRVSGGISALLGLFKFRVVMESFVDYEGIFSHRMQFAVQKGGAQVKDPIQMDHVELFESEKGEAYYWNHSENRPKGSETGGEKKSEENRASIVPFSQDPLSQIYYLRSIPLNGITNLSIPVVMKGKNFEVIGQILRKEMLDTIQGPKMCFVILFKRKLQDKFVEGESTWWVSDDEWRIPYLIEGTSKLGKFTLTLKTRDQAPNN